MTKTPTQAEFLAICDKVNELEKKIEKMQHAINALDNKIDTAPIDGSRIKGVIDGGKY